MKRKFDPLENDRDNLGCWAALAVIYAGLIWGIL